MWWAVCGTVSCSILPHSLHCVRCYSIVGLVSCLCDRVVSLWNSGGGLRGGCDGGACHVVSYCVALLTVEWRGVCGLVARLLFLFSLLLCRGVRGSARAALRARTLSPNTIVFSRLLAVVFSSLSLAAFSRCPPFFVFGIAVGVTMCWCVVLA